MRSGKDTDRKRIVIQREGRDGGLMSNPSGGQPKVMKVSVWLRVEGNNKYVRGKKKAREEIEAFVLRQYGMEKLQADGWEYVLSIPYETDEELDETIYQDILGEAENIAERRLCFIEADVTSLDDPDRSW
jgi:hypothetical protein